MNEKEKAANPLRPTAQQQSEGNQNPDQIVMMSCEFTSRDAINILKELHLAENRRKYPTIEEHCRVRPTYTDRTANGLTKCIIIFLSLNGWQAERINCTGRPIDHRRQVTDCLGNNRMIGSIEYVHTTGTRGTADISATIAGRSVKIEVKIGADRQSEYQKQYQRTVEAAGGVYVIARNFGQFLTWYNVNFGNHGNQ